MAQSTARTHRCPIGLVLSFAVMFVGLFSVSADDLSVGVDSVEVRSLDSRSSIYARLKSRARGRFFSGKSLSMIEVIYDPYSLAR